MRISVKMVLLVVCVSAGLVCGAAKNDMDGKVEPNDTKAAVTPAKETAVKPEVKEAKPAAPAVKAAEPNAAAENTGVAVTVNGKDIMEADVDAKMNAYRIEQYKRPQMVESMVMEQLLEEQIKKAGVNVTDNDVNDKLNEYIAAQPGMTMEVLKARVTSQGQSFEQIKEQIKKTVSYEKLIGNVEVNDAEAKAFYDENKEDFNKLMAGDYPLNVEVTVDNKKVDVAGIITFSAKFMTSPGFSRTLPSNPNSFKSSTGISPTVPDIISNSGLRIFFLSARATTSLNRVTPFIPGIL